MNMLKDRLPGGMCLDHDPPGTSKSFLMKQILKAIVESGRSVLVCSSMDRTVNQLTTALGSMARSHLRLYAVEILQSADIVICILSGSAAG